MGSLETQILLEVVIGLIKHAKAQGGVTAELLELETKARRLQEDIYIGLAPKGDK